MPSKPRRCASTLFGKRGGPQCSLYSGHTTWHANTSGDPVPMWPRFDKPHRGVPDDSHDEGHGKDERIDAAMKESQKP